MLLIDGKIDSKKCAIVIYINIIEEAHAWYHDTLVYSNSYGATNP